MCRYDRSHLADQTLLSSAQTNAGRERASTADLLADLAEIDARRLYLPAAYPSLFAFCVGELHLSEEAAFKRIHAARVARRFPAVFEALASGRLHLSAVVMLAPHLTEDTAAELLAAATHKTKAEIERLLAERFPRPDVMAWVAEIPPSSPAQSKGQHAPGRVESSASPGQTQHAPGRVGSCPRVTPLSSQSYAVQFTMNRSAHEKLRYAQELLSHQVPSGDIAQVIERVLDLAIPRLEKRTFAATGKPRPGGRATHSARHIPADVRRTVWQRDQGQCTYVSDTGHRCPARKHLQFDHLHEVARGGKATVSGIRLLCRAHNQHAAERTFGAEFMRRKRIAAAEARDAAPRAHGRDVVPYLRALGFRADEAREAAALCDRIPDAALEERVRLALSYFRPRGTRVARAG